MVSGYLNLIHSQQFKSVLKGFNRQKNLIISLIRIIYAFIDDVY